jgi:Ca2+-binding RTX toxin-like protein
LLLDAPPLVRDAAPVHARRALAVLIALSAAAAALPASASAGIATRANDSNVLMLIENGAEVNTMTVTLSGGVYTIADDANMGAGANCNDNTPDPKTVTCPAAAVVTLMANLGPGNDKFTSLVATPTKVLGGTGLDELNGGTGPDELIGGPENDTLNGGAGNDLIVAESVPRDTTTGQNKLDGGSGDDVIEGGAGVDTIDGGADADMIEGGNGPDTVDGGDGADAVSGAEGNDVVRGGPGNDRAGGVGERGSDDIDGGEGDDVLEPGDGANGPNPDDDALAGGSGFDEVNYAGRSVPVVVTIGDGGNDGQGGEHDDVKGDVEAVTGGNADDQLRGSANAEALRGGPGGDVLDGGGGADTTEGGDGNDTVSGGDGADTVMGGAGDDQLNGNVAGGAPAAARWLVGPFAAPRQASLDDGDTLDGGDGNDSLAGGPGADRMSGGSGVDTASYSIAKSSVFVTLDAKADDGEFGEGDSVGIDVENLGGSFRQDTFTGSDATNAMSSAEGQDYIDGAGGPDSMSAGAGLDVIRARDGVADSVDCGGSMDFAIVDKEDTVAGSCERTDSGLVKRPRRGRLLLLQPLRGGEAFGLQGMTRTVPLKDRLGLPPGVKLDATSGAVRLTAATVGGRAQSGDFSKGAFLVKQKRSARGLTELALVGGDLTKCSDARGKPQGTAARTVLRRLFGRAHGRFRTRGRYSTATVRGTTWTVTDRCDGTLTTVQKGTVLVRDRVKHRTVRLKAGQRYLARRGSR